MNPFAYIRSLIMIVVFPIFTFFVSFFALIESLTINNRKFEDRIILFWARTTLKLFGVKIVEKGLENIPHKGCLFLFNHTSFFDIFAIHSRIGGVRFGSKIELFNIPIFGRAMKNLGVLPIARKQREKVFQVYEEAKARAELGEKFALSPEGGRNTEERLLPFKAGPFLFAIRSGIPLVPVVIKGAKEILGKKDLIPNVNNWTSVITVEYLPEIQVDQYTPENYKELQGKTFDLMKSFF